MKCKEQKTNCEECPLQNLNLLCMIANTINDSDIEDLIDKLKTEIKLFELSNAIKDLWREV